MSSDHVYSEQTQAWNGQNALAKGFTACLHANLHFVGKEISRYFYNQHASSPLHLENVTWRFRTLTLVLGCLGSNPTSVN